MDKISVRVEVEIHPTESEEKVKQAVEKLFGNLPTQTKPLHKGNLLVAEGKGLDALTALHDLLRREHTRSAARTVFLEGMDKRSVSFCLNKQVAYVGHVSFSKEMAESPLGPIKVRIECEDPRQIIQWLTAT